MVKSKTTRFLQKLESQLWLKRNSQKLSNQDKVEGQSFIGSCLIKLLKAVPVALLLFSIIFIWSSSTIFISGSIARVCVTSKKHNSLYCISAAAHQPAQYDLLLPAFNNSSKTSVLEMSTNSVNETTKTPARKTETKEVSSFVNLPLRKGTDKAKAERLSKNWKVIEGQLAMLRTYIAKSKTSDCEKRGIYVYDLPCKFNKKLLAMCDEMMPGPRFCNYLSNEAMGEAIPELGEGWYNTHQYSLEPIFHNRILNHPCRVYNPEEAKLFYVPYYGGFDVLRWHFKNVSDKVKDTLSNELVEWLDKKWMWKRNSGLDHVFVLGKITWDFRRWQNGSWGNRLLDRDKLQNPMKLLIERQPWQINEVGVPHPTYFHPSSDDDIIAWQEKIRQVQRKYFISFAGASRKASENIRSILIDQCTSSPTECNFLNCAKKDCVKSATVVKLFMETEFCLQPPGDSPTRKSVFDSLIAGCIPVIFDPFTAYYQYPWHLPEDHRKYSVFIDQDWVKMSEVNVVEELVKIPLNKRQDMRKYIIDELMPRLVYAEANAELEKFQDAFMISVNNLLQMVVSRFP